jgi:methylthioribose-1-phosphate isomerase
MIALLVKKIFGAPGIYIVAALAVALAVWGSGELGYRRGSAICEAGHKVAAAIEMQRQERAGAVAVAASEATTTSDAAKDKSNQEAIRYVVKTVYARPDAGVECVPAVVADRLRSLD